MLGWLDAMVLSQSLEIIVKTLIEVLKTLMEYHDRFVIRGYVDGVKTEKMCMEVFPETMNSTS